MQNENRKPFFAGKGYYIALIACLAAVGISGYVFLKTARSSAVETMETVAAIPTDQAQQTEPAAQTVRPSPSGTPSPSAAPKPARTGGNSSRSDAAALEEPEVVDAFQETDLMEDAYEEDDQTAAMVLWPVQGDVVAAFSRDTLTYSQTMADWRTHEGLDVAADHGSLVTATQDGTVTAVYEDDFLGNVVVISHSGDLATLYANLADDPSVAVGDWVLAGEVLGQVGASALLEAAEPAHLHFEVYENGIPVDPLSYLPG